jgi:predicted anti-sigma-YlaC factor YlaD
MSGGLTCRELIEFLDDYIDGSLEEHLVCRFRQHLDACPPCRDYLESYRGTVRLLGCVCPEPDGAVPEDVPDHLVRAVLDLLRPESDPPAPDRSV